jgi:hypothetical protein
MRNFFVERKIAPAGLSKKVVPKVGRLLQSSHEQLADARGVLSGHLVRVPKKRRAKCNNTSGV